LLWLLEDFAAGSENEVNTILEHNIITRILELLKIIISQVDYLVVNAVVDAAQFLPYKDAIGQIFTILSNISAENIGARKDIIKYGTLDLL
jgi:hypothetical protein